MFYESPVSPSQCQYNTDDFDCVDSNLTDPFNRTNSKSYASWADRVAWDLDIDLFVESQLMGDSLDTLKPRGQMQPSLSPLSTLTEQALSLMERTPNQFLHFIPPAQDHFANSQLDPVECNDCALCREAVNISLPTPSSSSYSGFSPVTYPDPPAYPQSQSPGKKRKSVTSTTSPSPRQTKARKPSVATDTDKRSRSLSSLTNMSSPERTPNTSIVSTIPAPALEPAKTPQRAHYAIEKRYRASLNDKFEALRSCIVDAKPWLAEQGGEGDLAEQGIGEGDEKEMPKMNKNRVLTEAVIYIRHLEEQVRSWQEQADVLQRRILTGRLALEGEGRGVGS